MTDSPTFVSAQATLARNSFANLIRVASTSLVSLVLPLVLVAVLRPELYAVWALLFGMAGFVLYLDFGLPTSVQALVARATADGDPASQRSAAVSGVRWSCIIGGAMLALLVVVSLNAVRIFPALSGTDSGLIDATLLLVALGNVSTLVGNTASAYFAALQRSQVAAVTLVPGRIASLVLAVPAAVLTQNTVLVATAYATPLVLGAVAIVIRMALASGAADRSGRKGAVSGRFAVLRYSGPLTAWSVYMLCISGSGILIVGRVEYRAVAIFSLATAFSAALTGVQSAIAAPILSELGRAYAAGNQSRATRLVLLAGALNGAIVAIGIVGIQALYLVFAHLLGRASPVSPMAAGLIVGLTVLGGGIRLTTSPLTFAFIGSGSHGRLLLPPACEAAVTVAASIGLGLTFGAVGVAAGLAVGGTCGALLALFWSHRVTRVVDATSLQLGWVSTVRPLTCMLVAEAVFLWASSAVDTPPARVLCAAAMVVTTAIALWCWGLPREAKSRAIQILRRSHPERERAARI